MNYAEELAAISELPVTVETIDNYSEQTLQALVSFVGQVTTSYAEGLGLAIDAAASGEVVDRSTENEALLFFGLPSLDTILTAAYQKIDQISASTDYIEHHVRQIDTVITPPDPTTGLWGEGNNETYHTPGQKQRLKTLLYVLQDLSIDLDTIEVITGKITPNMMRRMSYITVTIPDLNRVVQLCDEEGNASYVFDLNKVRSRSGLDELNAMTKIEKEDFINQYADDYIGKRLTYQPYWHESMRELLVNDDALQSGKSVDYKLEVLERVADESAGEWAGFWEDNAGQHWSSMRQIAIKLNIAYNTMKKIIDNDDFASIRVMVGNGARRVAYCYESLASAQRVIDIQSQAETDSKGEWAGFWTDASANKHFASINVLARRYNTTRAILDDLIKPYKDEIESITIRAQRGKPGTGYCLEDVEQIEDVMRVLALPRAEKAGEWLNFWIDPESKEHYGQIKGLASKLNFSPRSVARLINELQLQPVEYLGLRGVSDAYSLEALANSPELLARTEAVPVETEGEWAGFYEDETGAHWGTLKTIGKLVGASHTTMSRIVKEAMDEGTTVTARKLIQGNAQHSGYCFEALSNLPRIQRLINAKPVEVAGAWEGFYVDAGGDQWAGSYMIAQHLGVTRHEVERNCENLPRIYVRVRGAWGPNGHVVQAYKLTEVKTILETRSQ